MQPIREPRLFRALAIQVAIACVCAAAYVVWTAVRPAAEEPAPEVKVEPEVKPEKLKAITVRVEPAPVPVPEEQPKLAQAPAEPPPQPPTQPQKPAPQPPKREPKREAEAEQPAPKAVEPSTKPAAVRRAIAVDQKDVHGIPLRVMVPSDPHALESHLARSQGCLVVSRVDHARAEIVDTFDVTGGRARPSGRAPCSGVPRVVRDRALLHALGDPLAQTRARLVSAGSAPGELVVQVVLSPVLLARADAAAQTRLGPGARDVLARKAAAQGYEIRCYAEAKGTVQCL